jgi:GT2 family glycosyltransferase
MTERESTTHLLVSFCNILPGAPALGLLDLNSYEFRVLLPPMPSEYRRFGGVTGLACSAEHLYVAVQEPDSLRPQGRPGPHSLMVFAMDDLSLVNHHVFTRATDIHSLCLAGTDLYVVSTGTDEVIKLKLDGARIQSEEIFWRPEPGPNGNDQNHLNAICGLRNDLIVSAFGSKVGEQWSSARNGFIANISTGSVIATGLLQPHSLMEIDGAIFYCESATRAVRILAEQRCQYLPGYTRGLCAVGRQIFAGTSIGRRVSKSTGLINNPFDDGLPEGQCTITCMAADSLRIERTIELGQYAREIYDLVPVAGVNNWPVSLDFEWRDRMIRELTESYERRTIWALESSKALELRDAELEARDGHAGEQIVHADREDNVQTLWLKECSGRIDELLSRMERLESRVDTINEALERNHQDTLDEIEVIRADLAARFGSASSDGKLEYRRAVRRVLEVIESELPPGATVLLVTKGDDALLQLRNHHGWHFPQNEAGAYAGFAPADSGSAIIQLEAVRAKGADFLVFPVNALWWLDHYSRFRDYLDRRYQLLFRRDDTCAIYALRQPREPNRLNVWRAFDDLLFEIERSIQRDPSVLDWQTNLGLGDKFKSRTIFSPPSAGSVACECILPYLDGTIDLVAVTSADPTVLSEARRVAKFAVVVCELGPTTEPIFAVEWLLDARAKPFLSTSIIIPSYNGILLTEACIRALQENLRGDFCGEIIVVDDASTDETPARMQHLMEQDRRIKYLRNPENIGFVGTCNRGAEVAGGDILVFLNNDTLPQPGWLEPLLRIFEDYPDAGAVGGKLVYPDGRLQEAGGLIFSDGSAANFGRGDFEVDAPLYNYVREVDYVTGALIATPRKLFEKLGGLDLRYRPIYYEETDYCFRLREAGFKVYYQPDSVVIHLEGVTCGTDGSAGQKRYQVLNQRKFVERWQEALRRQPDNPHHFDAWTWYGLAVREEKRADGDDSLHLCDRRTVVGDQHGNGKKECAI